MQYSYRMKYNFLWLHVYINLNRLKKNNLIELLLDSSY